jgi:hypothetical protein
LRILITNHTLANRAGTELYVRDVAGGLVDRGHEVTAYSTQIGDVAEDLRAAGVTVTDDLDTLAEHPDIIHGQHHLETMTALLCLPETPAIFFCHGSTPWQEAAPRFPRILRYVAVDQACRDRLIGQHAIPPDRIRLILNFVDLQRFKPRASLPERPRRALIFSNQATEDNYVGPVRAACEHAGMSLDVVGLSAGKVCADPEAILGDYDLVFAKGRAALEALAVGASVVVCDAAGAGPMVSGENVARLRPLNFGVRLLKEKLTVEVIANKITNYNPADTAIVSSFIRKTAGRDAVLDQLLSLYREVIQEYGRMSNPDRLAEQAAAAAYLRELQPRLRDAERLATVEAQLEMIKNSRGWMMVSRYAAIKHKIQRKRKRRDQ